MSALFPSHGNAWESRVPLSHQQVGWEVVYSIGSLGDQPSSLRAFYFIRVINSAAHDEL